jgi:hypothetical protein
VNQKKKNVTLAARKSRWSSSAGNSVNAKSVVTRLARSACRISCPGVAALVQSAAITDQRSTAEASIRSYQRREATAEQPRKLFAEGELADFLIARWKLALAEVQAARQAGGGDGSAGAFASILGRYHLKSPVLMAECKIIEHGWEEDPAADVGLGRRARPEDCGSHGDSTRGSPTWKPA